MFLPPTRAESPLAMASIANPRTGRRERRRLQPARARRGTRRSACQATIAWLGHHGRYRNPGYIEKEGARDDLSASAFVLRSAIKLYRSPGDRARVGICEYRPPAVARRCVRVRSLLS